MSYVDMCFKGYCKSVLPLTISHTASLYETAESKVKGYSQHCPLFGPGPAGGGSWRNTLRPIGQRLSITMFA